MFLKSTVFCCILLCFNPLIGQPLKVLKHRGVIKNTMTLQYLKKGSYYHENDSLEIKSDTCRLAVVDKFKKVFIMRPKELEGQWLPQYYPIPQKVQGRSGFITSSINLIKHLNEEKNYLIAGDEYRVEVSPHFFRMNKDSFFYIRYYWKGETIDKKLPVEGNHFIISKKDLFQAKFFADERLGKDTIVIIPQEEAVDFEFRCVNCDSGRVFFDPSQLDHLQRREFVPIKLNFLDSKEVEAELEFIISALKSEYPSISEKKLFNRVHAYLEERFEGKIERLNLENWIEENFSNLHSFGRN